MGNITVNEIFSFFGTLASGIAAIGIILAGVNKILDSKLRPIRIGSDKNFLVRFLADIEQGNEVDETEIERFYEVYKEYIDDGGNSYVKRKVEKLQKEGKL